MNILFVIFATKFIVVVLCAELESKKFIDFRLAQKGRLANRYLPPSCDTFGMVCGEDCKSTWMCLSDSAQHKVVLTEICPGNQTCNDGICSDTPTPKCSAAGRLPFVCTSEGVFPDPMDCRSYHYCIAEQYNDTITTYLIDYSRKCEYFGFNPRTTYCQNYLYGGKCPSGYPVPICERPGQSDVVSGNPTLYYVCSLYENTGNILYPYIYLCPNGQQFSPLSGCFTVETASPI